MRLTREIIAAMHTLVLARRVPIGFRRHATLGGYSR
jgi:hypothetical protein